MSPAAAVLSANYTIAIGTSKPLEQIRGDPATENRIAHRLCAGFAKKHALQRCAGSVPQEREPH
ncbi:hypothetical protein [Roseibium sp.]|uniref:hypothetical protein n=1 Tax=Roseibium sp. TaxID=1936156 RepID=UPI003A96FF9F